MKIVIAFLIVSWILLIIFPELIWILIWIFMLVVWWISLLVYLKVKKNSKNWNMSESDFVQVWKYKININKDKK